MPGGGERLHLPVNVLALTEDYIDMDARLAFMDRMGVDAQLLSLAGLFGADSLPVEEAQPICETFNNEAAALQRSHPERFACLAALPFADMDAALAEYRRGRELGLVGAVLPMNFFDSLEQAERLRPLFDLAEALGGHLFLHPGPRPDQRPDLKAGTPAPFSDNGVYRSSLEVQNKVGQAMVTLLMTDFLDGYGNLTVHVANLAGTLPAIVERLDHIVITRDPDAPLPSSMMRSRGRLLLARDRNHRICREIHRRGAYSAGHRLPDLSHRPDHFRHRSDPAERAREAGYPAWQCRPAAGRRLAGAG